MARAGVSGKALAVGAAQRVGGAKGDRAFVRNFMMINSRNVAAWGHSAHVLDCNLFDFTLPAPNRQSPRFH
jgi:hypothetical protein